MTEEQERQMEESYWQERDKVNLTIRIVNEALADLDENNPEDAIYILNKLLDHIDG